MTDLENELRELGAHLEVPPTPDLARSVSAELRRPARSPRWGWAAAAAAAAVAVAVVLPGPRSAIADLLGIGGVEISSGKVDATPRPGAPWGREMDINEARAALGWDVYLPEALGAPAATYLNEDVPGGAITFEYGPSRLLPESPVTGVGALVTELLPQVERGSIHKLVEATNDVRIVDVDGTEAYWIEGPHEVLLDSGSSTYVDEPRLATNTLVYTYRGVTFRLEADISRRAAIEIAESTR